MQAKRGAADQPSYIRKIEDEQTEFPDESLLGDLNKSYAALNQKQYKNRGEYLFERGMVQQKTREILHRKSQEKREKEELKQCTFKPAVGPHAQEIM